MKLYSELTILREKFEKGFSPETALGEFNNKIPSTGHCAVASIIIQTIYGGKFVSTYINNISHWFNRIIIDNQEYDIDLTGDQFNLPKIQIKPAGSLYSNTRIRETSDLNEETKIRSKILANKINENI